MAPGLRPLLDAAIEAARDFPGASLWAVGGQVRDLAAGIAVRDLDLVTDGGVAMLAHAVAASLETPDRGAPAVRLEPRFGTASVTLGSHRLDLATLRSECYARPGVLPTVRLGATIETDLARRDFTVNAVALGVAGPARGRLLDPFGGLADLEARRLRVLHERSFLDDATRLWRAARFAARLRIHLEPDTARLAAEAVRTHALDPIAARRLWREWSLLAVEPRAGAAVLLLEQWGVLGATEPALRLAPAARDALTRLRGPLAADPIEAADALFALVVASLRAPARAAVAARLGAPRSAIRAAEATARLLAVRSVTPSTLANVEGTPSAARRAARRLDPIGQPPLQRALARWERTRPHLDARALMALGVPPGPGLGTLLERLRRARYLGTLIDAAAARAQVQRWLTVASRRAQTAPARARSAS